VTPRKDVPTLAQQQAHSRATSLLSSHMIDPRSVLTDGLSEEGYFSLAYDIDGRQLLDVHHDLVKVARTWPVGFPVDDFLAAVREWQGAEL
jgi:hypothetical protein